MGRATTNIETRLNGVDATAGAFASVKRRFAAFDRKSVFTRELNPFAGFGKTNLAKGVGAGFKDVGGIGKALGSGAAMAGSLGGALLTATARAGALGLAIAGLTAKKGLDTILEMDQLGDAAQKIGMTANELKRMDTVFQMAGIGGRELAENVIPKMNKALGETAGQNALEKLGLSFEALKTMSAEERFKTIGAAIANVGNDLERAQLETDLFGKSGIQLDAIWRQGGDAFRKAYSDVGNLAAKLDAGGVAAAGRFANAWEVAKDRADTAWKNLVGGLLTSFEDSFGPVDKWLLGVWTDASASAQIFWLEFTTNGPAHVEAFFKNAAKFLGAFVSNWREGLSWIWDSFINMSTSMIIGAGKFGKAVWAGLKGEKSDWQGVWDAFKIGMPDFNDFASRTGVKWDKPATVDLTAEKAKIRAEAAERKLQDAKSLESANRLFGSAAAANLIGAADAVAKAFDNGDGVGSALLDKASAAGKALDRSGTQGLDPILAGSYDAFKLGFGTVGAMPGAGASGGEDGASSGAGGSSGGTNTVFAQLLATCNSQLTVLTNMLALNQGSGRDVSLIRNQVETIGVA